MSLQQSCCKVKFLKTCKIIVELDGHPDMTIENMDPINKRILIWRSEKIDLKMWEYLM